MACSWDTVTLGRSGLQVSPLGLSSSFGTSAADVERAFDRGINYLYWGSARTTPFGEGIRNVARTRREQMVIVVQSYTRAASLMLGSLERALRKLGTDYTDLLLLGWWNKPPPRRILDAAIALRDKGRARHIMISCHDRSTFAQYMADPAYDAIMVRYNAAHPGAEREVFPLLDQEKKPGVIAYTATRWGALIDPQYTPQGEKTPRAPDCYRFALSNPSVDVCLFGPKDTAQLDEGLTALDLGPMSADELAWMKRVGVHVRAATMEKSKFSPVTMLDKIDSMFTRSDSASR